MRIVFLDKTLVCEECGKEFIWPAGEQEFFAVMGFDNIPKRCPDCRKQRRYRHRRPPVMYETTCAQCGEITVVPFVPTQGRPVYCRSCLEMMKEGSPGGENRPSAVA